MVADWLDEKVVRAARVETKKREQNIGKSEVVFITCSMTRIYLEDFEQYKKVVHGKNGCADIFKNLAKIQT